MKYGFGWIFALCMIAVPARAERTLAALAEMDTPRKALKFFDRVGTDSHVDRATLFYYAKNESETKVARAFASVDLELAKLRKAATARFDVAAGDAMVHALREVTADDIDAAQESITGNHAQVTGKRFTEPLPMVKVKGQWKVSLTDCIAQSEASADDLVLMCDDLVEAMQLTEQEMLAEKFANPSLLERAMKRRVRALVGEE